MKMKITAIFLIIMYIISIFAPLSLAESDSVKIEGEKYSSISFSGAYNRTSDNFSGGKALLCYVTMKNEEFSITYNVTAPKDGVYTMKGITTRFGVYYTTDFYIQVNGGRTYLPNVKSECDYTWEMMTRKDYMALNNFGNVKLKKGDNTIKITFREDDPHITDDDYIVIIDYFEFIPAEVETAVMSIEPQTDTAFVFYNDESVGFDLEFTNAPCAEVYYTVKNLWGNVVKQGSLYASEDVSEIKLGTMSAGWYTMEITNMNFSDGIPNPTFFSVVERCERPETSPFGADKQSNALFKDEKINKAVSAAGIKTIRSITDPYLGVKFENYRETHEDLWRDSETSLGMSALLTHEHFGTNYSQKLPNDLLEAYKMNRETAEHYKGRNYAYEIWNEEESNFLKQPADVFASYFKTAAIAVSDGDGDALKMFGGFGATPDVFFIRTLLRNGVTDYSDAYAYHNHQIAMKGKVSPNFIESSARRHTNTARAYDPEMQIWTTEAGISMMVEEDGEPSLDTLISQAKYYIVATAEQLAYGSDKSFWFRLNHFIETGNDWSNFSEAGQPYPVINAISVMTSKLGTGEYLGTLRTDNSSKGFMFNNGKNDVAVVWSDSDTRCQFYTDTPVSVTDITGKVLEYQPCYCESGLINLPITYTPIFIEFDGKSDERNYFKTTEPKHRQKAKTYGENERLVIQQIWSEQDENEAKKRGYVLEEGKNQNITVNIYNFNDTEKTGKIYLETGDILKLDNSELSFSVEPMSKQEFSISAELLGNADMGEIGFLKIYAETDTGKSSDSVAAFYADDSKREVSGYSFFENFNDASNWALGTRASGVTLSAESGTDSLKINVNSENDYGSFYWPTYTLKESAENKSGIAFYIRSTSGKEQNVNVYAYCSDGSYWLGYANSVSYGSEWKQVIIPWYRFISFTSSNYEGSFDAAKIKSIGIGSYAPKGETSYEIKDLGFYSSDSRADKSDKGEDIRIEGIKDGGTYKRGSKLKVNAYVGDGENVKISFGGNEITDFEIKDSVLAAEICAEERGEYILQITKEDNWNYKNSESVKIYVK